MCTCMFQNLLNTQYVFNLFTHGQRLTTVRGLGFEFEHCQVVQQYVDLYRPINPQTDYL